MELMMAVFRVAQGMVSSIISSSGLSAWTATTLPDEMVTIIEDVGLIESIPLWAVTLLGSLDVYKRQILTIAGGIVITFTKEILTLITGG